MLICIINYFVIYRTKSEFSVKHICGDPIVIIIFIFFLLFSRPLEPSTC